MLSNVWDATVISSYLDNRLYPIWTALKEFCRLSILAVGCMILVGHSLLQSQRIKPPENGNIDLISDWTLRSESRLFTLYRNRKADSR